MARDVKEIIVSVRVSEDTKKALIELAKAERRTLSNYLGVVLDRHVSDQYAAGEQLRLADVARRAEQPGQPSLPLPKTGPETLALSRHLKALQEEQEDIERLRAAKKLREGALSVDTDQGKKTGAPEKSSSQRRKKVGQQHD